MHVPTILVGMVVVAQLISAGTLVHARHVISVHDVM